jgi:hypothetical protein
MNPPVLEKTLLLAAAYFDGCKVGYTGTKGYRKSTDLSKFTACIAELEAFGIVSPDRTVFADLGCADGRVNLLMSYFVKLSLGIEIDSEILLEYTTRKKELFSILEREAGILPPENIFLFRGSSLDDRTYEEIHSRTGISFEDVDIFYTYITLHDVFAEKIAARGRRGAHYLVYGFNRVLPRYEGFELVLPDVGSQGIAALFKKTA